MKVAYVEVKRGFPVNTDMMCAIEGLEYLGWDIKTFTKEDILSNKYSLLYTKSPFIGSIDSITEILRSINKLPSPIDYPETNRHLLGRKLTFSTMSEVLHKFKNDNEAVFIKPVKTKLFDGSVLKTESRFSYFEPYLNEDVISSPLVEISSEWRAYIHKGKIMDCRCYSKDFRLAPDYQFIELNIKAYRKAPVAYTIDVAILENENNIVVEFNDFWSIGSYGLDSEKYAEMLVDRWFEIIK